MSEENTTAEVVSAELPQVEVVVAEEVKEEEAPKTDEKADGDKSIKALQRRIDRLTREKYQLRAENEQLRTPQNKGEESIENDDGRDVETRAQELAQEIAAIKEFNKRCDDVADKGLKLGNFKEAMATFSEEIGGAFDANGKPSHVMLAVLDADEPHKLIVHLGENPETASELAKLSPAKQIRRIAQIERDMAEAAKPTPNTAPKPAQPVKASGESGEPDPKDTKRWIEYENEKLAARRAGRRF